MKKLLTLFIITIILLSGCGECGLFGKERGNVPSPPHGTPDDKTTYVNGEYYSVTYTYYCYAGNYRAITYTSLDKCSEWERSDYTSDCIGD